MKVFHCDHCRQLVFFENSHCAAANVNWPTSPIWVWLAPSIEWRTTCGVRPALPRAKGQIYRLCDNYTKHDVWNWQCPPPIPTRSAVRPVDARDSQSKSAWKQGSVVSPGDRQTALFYSLLVHGLPLENRHDKPKRGLAYDFLADPARSAVDLDWP